MNVIETLKAMVLSYLDFVSFYSSYERLSIIVL